MKTIKTALFIIAICIISINVNAQRIQIAYNYLQGIHYNSNWDLFGGGSELAANYQIKAEPVNFIVGANFRTVQWGSQTGILLGARKQIAEKLELGIGINNGIALFRQKKLYTFEMGANLNYLLIKKEKFAFGFSAETRYTTCPAYKDYSQIYRLWEIPVGVFVRF